MTGIAPYVVQGTGASGIILIGVMTIAGCFLCLCLAELATMWPDRTGGIPGYATESFRPLVGNTASRHIGGVSGWAYWLGWFPVAPINVILTASYLAVLFNFSPGHLITPVGTTWGAPIGITIVFVCFALLLAIFIPAWFGIRLGAAFATVLGILSMLPITAMIFLPFFKPGSIHWGNVAGFHAPPHVAVTVTFIFAWFFPILWNVIAMEAAACYIGECRGGARDAKIALTAEGLFAMIFNVVCSAILVLLGSPLRIYIISNGGYLLSCSLALAGYFVYRQLRPDTPRPFRLPTFAKWIALLASAGTPFSGAAVRRAYELAAGEPIAVLTILKVYGSSFGLPNPGLLPTRRERDEQYTIVRRAIAAVERRGGTADGQIAATRSAGRTIVKVTGSPRRYWRRPRPSAPTSSSWAARAAGRWPPACSAA